MTARTVINLPDGLVIRPVEARDNVELAQLITEVWAEFDNSTTYFIDPEAAAGITANVITENSTKSSGYPEQKPLSQTYQTPPGQPVDRALWVIFDERNQRVLGAGGFAHLVGAEDDICELQKLYFHADLRGKGLGRQLLSLILEEAAQAGYREMYLESIQEMSGAIRLYEKLGFQTSPERKGTTGHWRCNVFMFRLLNQPAQDTADVQPVSVLTHG